MASKKTRNKGPRAGSKTAFVLGLPKDMPAKDAVAAAKAKGISISVGYVHGIRSAHGRKGKNRGPGRPRRGPGRPSKRGRGARRAAERARAGGSAGDLDHGLRAAIAELGLARTRQILDEVAAAFGG